MPIRTPWIWDEPDKNWGKFLNTILAQKNNEESDFEFFIIMKILKNISWNCTGKTRVSNLGKTFPIEFLKPVHK